MQLKLYEVISLTSYSRKHPQYPPLCLGQVSPSHVRKQNYPECVKVFPDRRATVFRNSSKLVRASLRVQACAESKQKREAVSNIELVQSKPTTTARLRHFSLDGVGDTER